MKLSVCPVAMLDAFTFLASALILIPVPVMAQSEETGSFMGPTSVPTQIDEIEATREKAAPSWPSFPSLDDYGLSLAADYNVLYHKLSDSPNDDAAAGGVARLYGTWTPLNRSSPDAGQLIFKVEHRHRLDTDLAPQRLLPNAGVAAVSGPTFSDAGGVLTNLYWRQPFDDNRFAFVAGVVDAADYTDVYGLVNPWTEFNNLAFATDPAIPVPSQGLGAAMRWLSASNYYVILGIADANGDPHKPGDFFSSFFSKAEFFKHIEFGRIGSWQNRSSDNTHVTVWQIDQREQTGLEDGWGVALSWSQTSGKWLPFARGGYADGGGTLVDRSISIGTGYALNERGDYFGFGANWGRPPAASTGGREEDQYIFETYYRLQVLRHMQVVPSVQYIRDPANSLSESSLWLMAAKMRLTF